MKEMNLYISNEDDLILLGMKAQKMGLDSHFCTDYYYRINLYGIVTEHIFYKDEEFDEYIVSHFYELPNVLSSLGDEEYCEEIGDKRIKVNCLDEEFIINFIIF